MPENDHSDAVLVHPPEVAHLLEGKTGRSLTFPIYFDATTDRTLICCDLCGKFYILGRTRSTVSLGNHRGKDKCKRRWESRDAEVQSGTAVRNQNRRTGPSVLVQFWFWFGLHTKVRFLVLHLLRPSEPVQNRVGVLFKLLGTALEWWEDLGDECSLRGFEYMGWASSVLIMVLKDDNRIMSSPPLGATLYSMHGSPVICHLPHPPPHSHQLKPTTTFTRQLQSPDIDPDIGVIVAIASVPFAFHTAVPRVDFSFPARGLRPVLIFALFFIAPGRRDACFAVQFRFWFSSLQDLSVLVLVLGKLPENRTEPNFGNPMGETCRSCSTGRSKGGTDYELWNIISIGGSSSSSIPQDPFSESPPANSPPSSTLHLPDCQGQWVEWYPGTSWDTYAYRQHEQKATPWILIEMRETRVRLRAKSCLKVLHDAHHYPSQGLLDKAAKKIVRLQTQISNKDRKLATVTRKLNDYKRLVMMLSQQKIAGASTILAIGLRHGDSPEALHKKLVQAVDGVYAPRSGWTDREYDIAFLAKALGGTRLLYVLQKAEAYPSYTTLKRKKSSWSQTGRKPPLNAIVGQTLMIDGVALEEACRYDHGQGHILGICREHAHTVAKLLVDDVHDIDNIANSLEQKACHHGKDGTVVALAPVTAAENYFPVPLVLSSSCKVEKGDELAKWLCKFIDTYHVHPDGEKIHGPIRTLATDGESSFRSMRFTLGVKEALDQDSGLGRILYRLPGFNCYTGANSLLTTCDPKHIVKRFATMIRSPKGTQIGSNTILRDDFIYALTIMERVTPNQAEVLLNPADKQNVPKAVRLLQTLLHESSSAMEAATVPVFAVRVQKIYFLATIFSYFLLPFVDVGMSLSEQITSLSAYSHLITAMFLKHRTAFMNGALFADSQAIVKNIIFTIARYQLADPDLLYYILFEGTDRLEGVFSHARTQDHARNFDILQLSHKLAIRAEINAIFERHPDLYRGHIRRNLSGAQGVDHVNPKSWLGNVRVGNVDIIAAYLAGRDRANQLLAKFLGAEGITVNWDAWSSQPRRDHLRPHGDYVGCRTIDEDPEYDDSQELVGGFAVNAAQPLNNDFVDARDFLYEEDEDSVVQDELIQPSPSGIADSESTFVEEGCEDERHDFVMEILNPTQKKRLDEPYLLVDGKMQHIDTLVARMLISDRARKLTTCTLRAQGVTVDETMRRLRNLNNPPTPDNDTNLVKSGDLGGFLLRVVDQVCLAVGEALNFRRGNSRSAMSSVDIEDLEHNTGSKAVSVAVQILDLKAHVPDRQINEPTYRWTKDYVQQQASKDGVINQRHLATRIPGSAFLPLGPDIVSAQDSSPVWALKPSDLKDTLKIAWDDMNPDSDEIVDNLEALPKILAAVPGLPYKSLTGDPELCITALPVEINVSKRDGREKLPCRLCGTQLPLSKMRNHVGTHILRALRIAQFKVYSESQDYYPNEADVPGSEMCANPCGWCGLEGCRTQLVLKGTGAKQKVTLVSDCDYHHSKMVYSLAKNSTDGTPCTNIPLGCPLCSKTRNNQPNSFWKYNFIQHMIECHHDPNAGSFPRIPVALWKSTHISRKEEDRMRIEVIQTEAYREMYQVPQSDGLDELQSEENDDLEAEREDEGDSEDEEHERETSAVRKRAFSSISYASTKEIVHRRNTAFILNTQLTDDYGIDQQVEIKDNCDMRPGPRAYCLNGVGPMAPDAKILEQHHFTDFAAGSPLGLLLLRRCLVKGSVRR
ncbi:hypothetical protein FPV67DRAFT_1457452 [Lyophyllum atratum]|nr:hypothetical protein FPV67DRAFT_1457452 [Lyophyllum atratum]